MPSIDRYPVWACLAAVLLVAIVGGTAAGSPTPTGVCVVCGQTFHQNVTATDATLQVQADGDIHWHVENEIAEPTAGEWRANPERAETLAREAVNRRYRHPHDATEPTVTVDGNSVVIEFVDRGAARERFGVLVVPYLHGEGAEPRYVINADEFVIQAPDGHRIVNDPAGATVGEDRAVWSGTAAGSDRTYGGETWDAPEHGDTYVIIGSGATATVGSSLALTFMPLDPGMYGFYAIALLVVVGLSAAGYAHARSELDRRWLAAVTALVATPFAGFLLSIHPIPSFGTLPGTATRVMLLILAILFGLVGALVFVVAAIVSGE